MVEAGRGPIVAVLSRDDARDLGITGLPPVSPYAPREGLAHALVSLEGVTVSSRPDPLGSADLDGEPLLGGLFGVGPGWRRTGDLVGILDGGRISPRSAEDWSGALEGDPPVEARLASLDQLPDGTPVALADLALATPWSRDGRWAVVQDRSGTGRWVDAEAWGLWASVSPEEAGDWIAEIRHDPGGVVLRVWDPPIVSGLREPVIGREWTDGALVEVPLDGIGPPDPFGERPSGGLILDDRFMDLGDLSPPITVTGAVRTLPGPPRLAVLP